MFKVKLHWNILNSVVERCRTQSGKMQKAVKKSFISLRLASLFSNSSHFHNRCLIGIFPTGLFIVMAG